MAAEGRDRLRGWVQGLWGSGCWQGGEMQVDLGDLWDVKPESHSGRLNLQESKRHRIKNLCFSGPAAAPLRLCAPLRLWGPQGVPSGGILPLCWGWGTA